MSHIKIADLKPKAEASAVYLVKYIAKMDSRDGKSYLNVVLADSSGDMEARVWHNAESIFSRVSKGDFAKVSGKVNPYQGRLQFIIQDIDVASEGSYDTENYLVKSENSPEEMYDRLDKIVTNLNDVYIKDLLLAILNDGEIKRRLKIWQAGKTIHHAYQSGLLEHILACATLADTLSDFYKVNKSYVVAGAILHDLCKIYELTDGFSVDYTEEGKLVGHLVKGVELVDRFSRNIKNFPYSMKMHLKHILLSHHGEYEYGSPKIPQTSEAMLVHQIDMMDSKMNTFETIKKTDKNQGHWSAYVKHLDRIVFKTELPTYTEYLKEEEKPEQTSAPKSKPRPRDKQITQGLGDKLKGFKVD